MNWLINTIQRAASVLFAPSVSQRAPKATVVGADPAKERQVVIAGIPHLFRDEDDHVAHFIAAFDHRVVATPYGDKLLPEVVPRWRPNGVHDGATVQEVAARAILDAAVPQTSRVAKALAASDVSVASVGRKPRAVPTTSLPQPASEEPVSPSKRARAERSSYDVGTLTYWGELEFPRRVAPGSREPETYKSFALKLDTPQGEKTLQGEGLKDAIAEARCKLGDRIAVKRLHKIKVAAFDQISGQPIMDRKTGEQKYWDKWVWKINLIH
ncbi:hypothetical protein [Cupriavidus numazuensis]|uniref:Uncharacterized protein n=1 Tax=Cupriavidus numazuensis TaxID=221992 RepID=A0ABN7QEH1_9BURK|nr:hypothetical protein [Cupriavidus numazuensis]CAG2159712.1 hypothetical protein LMG26411_06916 [Cupriavidus numazuensis]